MNDNQMILDKLNNSERNKKRVLLIASIVGILMAIIIVLIVVFKPGREESNSKDITSTNEKYDTTTTGDAETDPETQNSRMKSAQL